MTINFRRILSGATIINYEKVEEKFNLHPKRICFSSFHKNSLKKKSGDDIIGTLTVPFKESIADIFKKETELVFFHTRYDKYWCPIKNEEDFEKVQSFFNKYRNSVFLRDSLDISIALAENFDENDERTDLGELEKAAKYDGCDKSLNKIVKLACNFIISTPYYKKTKYICSVPPSTKNSESFPNILVNKIAAKLELSDISSQVSWVNNKPPLKEVTFKEKWELLERTDVKVEGEFKNVNIILVDDLYQSGTTIQYIAMKLKAAGILKVYGLSIVKSRKNTDNI
ncbi:MAG: hypothetical protein JXA68_10620 [Ignavibacteriales bacterium]|nr:hypothetical protein [Ignavibacteriales bacterium]